MPAAKTIKLRCLYCNRPIDWRKGQPVCCDECLPRREAETKELDGYVRRAKLKALEKK